MTYGEMMEKAAWGPRPSVAEMRNGPVMAQWTDGTCRIRVSPGGWVLYEEKGAVTLFRMDSCRELVYDVNRMDGESMDGHCFSAEEMKSWPWEVTAALVGQERAWHNREVRAGRWETASEAELYRREDGSDPLEIVVRKEEKILLRKALSLLEPREREALLRIRSATRNVPATTLRRRRKKAAVHVRNILAS